MYRDDNAPAIENVARLLADANDVLFITGAGISADSGIPTYRGVGGLYEESSVTDDGFTIEEALSGPMFAARPDVTWKYLWQIGAACAGAQPNAAHLAIAELEAANPGVWVMTQNVDGLHRAAGTLNLVEVHGHAFELYCIECRHAFSADLLFSDLDQTPSLPPRCDDCGGIVRPNVVLFEEMLFPDVLAKMQELSRRRFDVVISIGTSSLFPYINAPVLLASQSGIPTVEINPSETDVSNVVDHRITLRAAEAMESIVQEMSLCE